MRRRNSSRLRPPRSRRSRSSRGKLRLYETKTNDLRDVQNAQDSYAEAVANAAAAQADLETAKLNLGYTKVFAPVDGYLTNVNTSPGTYVNEGEQLLALVDSSSFWIAAYFKETQLRHIREGAVARITLMGHDFEPFQGKVVSVAWGIFYRTDRPSISCLRLARPLTG